MHKKTSTLKAAAACFALLSAFADAMAFDIIAHRGENSQAPENSVEAAKLAWQNGAKILEGDFYMTDGGEIVCIHGKEELKKFSGVEKDIEKLTAEDLKKINLADNDEWRGKYKHVAIPTLADIMKTVPKDGKLFLEIKSWRAGFGKKVDEIRSECGLVPEQVVAISFSPKAIQLFKEETGFIYETVIVYEVEMEYGVYKLTPEQVMAQCVKYGATGVDAGNTPLINGNYVKQFKDSEYKFYVWTVDDFKEAKRLKEIGVDGVTTNLSGEFIKKFREL